MVKVPYSSAGTLVSWGYQGDCFCGPDKGNVMIRGTLEGQDTFMFCFLMRRLIKLNPRTMTKKIEDMREGSRSFPP